MALKISTQRHNYCVIKHFISLKEAYHIDELRVHYVFNEGSRFVQRSPRITQGKPTTHNTHTLKYDKTLNQWCMTAINLKGRNISDSRFIEKRSCVNIYVFHCSQWLLGIIPPHRC